MAKNPVHNIDRTSFKKRSVLMGRIALFCTVFAMLHFSIDFSQGLIESAIFDFAIAVVIFGCYLLNRRGHHLTAKITALTLVNMSLAVYASVIPKDVGIYLFFFPLMVVSAALFDVHEKIFRYLFIVVPFVLLVLLFLSDFHLLGDFAFEPPPSPRLFFLINITSSGCILVMSVNFMLNLHESSEQELQKLAEQVNAKNADLERTNDELDRFIYSTSHDLQSPLSSIKGLINIARHDTNDEKMLPYFDMMKDRISRLELFIKDIIDYSKNTRTTVSSEGIDFDNLIKDVVDQLKFIEGAAEISLRKVIKVTTPVQMDKKRLSIVLSNLLANAVKYHDQSKSDRWIEVSVQNHQKNIMIQVSDNGLGIAQEHQEKIFDMFYRGTVHSKGSGLGLFIVKQAVEKMNGSIQVFSTLGEGTTFQILLPVVS